MDPVIQDDGLAWLRDRWEVETRSAARRATGLFAVLGVISAVLSVLTGLAVAGWVVALGIVLALVAAAAVVVQVRYAVRRPATLDRFRRLSASCRAVTPVLILVFFGSLFSGLTTELVYLLNAGFVGWAVPLVAAKVYERRRLSARPELIAEAIDRGFFPAYPFAEEWRRAHDPVR